MKFIYQNTSSVTDEQINKTAETLTKYKAHLQSVAKQSNYEADEASINLPFDDVLIDKVTQLAKQKTSTNLKYLVIIGIGGSNLGTKAIYDAFYGYYDLIQNNRLPKIIFLDTQDAKVLGKTIELINSLDSKEEILINAISKSGGTTETAANLEVIYAAFSQKFEDINDRIVITTDSGSKMQKAAEAKSIDVLNLPAKVGGRFSVFSAVGMFPFAVIGFDIKKMREGTQSMRDMSLQEVTNNPALLSAIILYLNYQKGVIINDNFIFLPQLESLGKWYRQLMGESIGKEGKGITPTVSIGSTDLHSVGQLYLGGPKDKVTTFIYSKNGAYETLVPKETSFKLVDVIAGKKVHSIMQAIVEGTKKAYQKQGLPFMEIILDGVSEYELGAFMQFKMMEMMYLGKLIGINTFDQPHVELYKVETKRILEST